MREVARLQGHLRQLGRVLLGYSGGVDSALLAVVATEALGPERFLAVIGKSASYPEVQYRAALGIAERFGVPLRELDTHELEDPRYRANPVDRCYFCKAELWTRLSSVARAGGFDTVIDGTNADDGREHRPGLVAGTEWRVRSRLRQVEAGEALLRDIGVAGDLRVRHLGDRASLEVVPAEFARLDARWSEITAGFRRLGFESVERDARGYRRGSLLVLEAAG